LTFDQREVGELVGEELACQLCLEGGKIAKNDLAIQRSKSPKGFVAYVELKFEGGVFIIVAYVHLKEGGNSIISVYLLDERQVAARAID
jgi:hypothetical protein